MAPRHLRFLPFALFLACASDPVSTLSVDLRSDYLPGVEITQVSARLELPGGEEQQRSFDLEVDDELTRGTRIASFESLEEGFYRVHVDARGASGELLASRLGAVELRGDLVVTVVLSRSCEGRMCPTSGGDPEATECVGGVCVPPECFPETPSLCGMRCSNDAECPSEGCGVGVCEDEFCQLNRDPSRCPSGLCGEDFACIDAPMDAGRDVPEPDVSEPDAGPPPPSCPANARSCPGPLSSWTPTSDWFCRDDEKIARAVHRVVCRVCNAGGCTDCPFDNIDVDCRCREPSTCSSGRCTSGVSQSSSRCDEGSMDNNFACPEITEVECR